MKVSGVQNKLPNIKTGNKLLDKALEVIPNTKVSKNLTRLDRDVFRAYCFVLKNKTGITQNEMNALFQKDGKEFIDSTYGFLLKKMDVDESIRPGLVYVEELPSPDLAMAYCAANNVVYVPKATLQKGYSKSYLYGVLRHELQHFKQQCDVLRCNEFSDKAMNLYVEQFLKNDKANVDKILRIYTADEILTLPNMGSDTLKKLAKMKNDEIAYNNFFVEDRNCIEKQYVELRANIIKTMGPIKEGSNEFERAKVYFEELHSPKYYDKNGNLIPELYRATIIEQEAGVVGDYAQFEAEGGGCYFKNLKEQVIEILKQQG